jgi:ribose transport system permease protein
VKNNRILATAGDQKILILAVVISAVMGVLYPRFLGFENIISILVKISIEGVIFIGMTYLIILGEIDLSVGSVMALCSAMSIIGQEHGLLVGVAAALATGLLVGAINGVLVVKLRVASIAVTLGMMVLLNGIVFVLTKSLAPAGGNYSIAGTNPNFRLITDTQLFGIPTLILILALLLAAFAFVLKKTVFGRNIYATGGNLTASRYANIKVDSVRIGAFVLTGLLSGLAGVLLSAKYNIASWQIGTNTPLFVITAVLLGGVSLSGGEGSLLRAFQGLLLVGVIDSMVVNLKIYPSARLMMLGALLIIMLSVDGIRIKRERYI